MRVFIVGEPHGELLLDLKQEPRLEIIIGAHQVMLLCTDVLDEIKFCADTTNILVGVGESGA